MINRKQPVKGPRGSANYLSESIKSSYSTGQRRKLGGGAPDWGHSLHPSTGMCWGDVRAMSVWGTGGSRELVHGVQWERREESRGEGEMMLEKLIGAREEKTWDFSWDGGCIRGLHVYVWTPVMTAWGSSRSPEVPSSLRWEVGLAEPGDPSFQGWLFMTRSVLLLFLWLPTLSAEALPGARRALLLMPYLRRVWEILSALGLRGEDAARGEATCLCLGVSQWCNRSPLPSGKKDERLKKLQTLMAVLRPPHPAQMFWETLAELWGTPIHVPGKHGSPGCLHYLAWSCCWPRTRTGWLSPGEDTGLPGMCPAPASRCPAVAARIRGQGLSSKLGSSKQGQRYFSGWRLGWVLLHLHMKSMR